MIGEVDIYGVFVPPLLLWVGAALPLTALLRRLLALPASSRHHVEKRMARPVGKQFLDLIRTVCANVSGLGATLSAQMKIRADRSS